MPMKKKNPKRRLLLYCINKKIFIESLKNMKLSGINVLGIAQEIYKKVKLDKKWNINKFRWDDKKILYIKELLNSR